MRRVDRPGSASSTCVLSLDSPVQALQGEPSNVGHVRVVRSLSLSPARDDDDLDDEPLDDDDVDDDEDDDLDDDVDFDDEDDDDDDDLDDDEDDDDEDDDDDDDDEDEDELDEFDDELVDLDDEYDDDGRGRSSGSSGSLRGVDARACVAATREECRCVALNRGACRDPPCKSSKCGALYFAFPRQGEHRCVVVRCCLTIECVMSCDGSR